MEWQGEGVLLSVRRHGESAAIIEVLTEGQGRHAGLVRGGGGRRLAPILQPGAQLALGWRARLADHLGNFTVEPLQARAGIMSDRLALAGLGAVTALAQTALAERQPFPALYRQTVALLDAMEAGAPAWPAHYIDWELALLAELGFGLELESCALTGAAEGLAWVSPKSGRAVAGGAGADWADRLLTLPPFLRADAGAAPITAADLADGMRLSGHFLNARLMPALGKTLPPARERLAHLILRL
ncbi:DNA repair protein RecO [Halovulum dunhuangense]|uniref:DNA repair protein RecO n=2 Tax=Halovulum dunhuangense TaxID=1505036 RepID=A0A849L5A5_9RHOB|nr:DNA repair protein RecO [Halovulum dunhuangense]NNU81549.1 DNA repair protein RecO [Halovulum dunhuangense]